MDSDLEHVFCDWLLMSAMGTDFCVCVRACVCVFPCLLYTSESLGVSEASRLSLCPDKDSQREIRSPAKEEEGHEFTDSVSLGWFL